jgi:hypothetical protein
MNTLGRSGIKLSIIVTLATLPALATAWAQNTQDTSAPAAVTSSVAAAAPVLLACCLLTANTPVVVQLAKSISSDSVKRGDSFSLIVAEPVTVDGKVVIPAGASGGGEVVDAGAAGLGGKPGKLVLAARYVDVAGVRVPLRAFHVSGGGRNNSATAVAVSETIALTVSPVGSVVGMLISGGNVKFPAGLKAIAKVAADVRLDPIPAAPSSSSSRESP